MPRTAFALPGAPDEVAAWRRAATRLLAGATTAATAVAGMQTMVALPIPEGRTPQVAEALAALDSGRAAADHQAVLAAASIREEWLWIQPAVGSVGDLVLVHWIGDDLESVWQLLADPGRHDGAAAVAGILTDLLGTTPAAAASWSVQQLLAMHVRRSDTEPGVPGVVATRIAAALGRGGWPALEQACEGTVALHGRPVEPAQATATCARSWRGAAPSCTR